MITIHDQSTTPQHTITVHMTATEARLLLSCGTVRRVLAKQIRRALSECGEGE